MIVLTREQIIRLHAELVAETGGSAGIRNEGMLSSALQAPFYCFDGVDMYPSVQAKVAKLSYGIALNSANTFFLSASTILIHALSPDRSASFRFLLRSLSSEEKSSNISRRWIPRS